MIKNRSIASIDDISEDEMIEIFDLTEKMLSALESQKRLTPMAGKIMATLFFEPSTRTRLSFESAMNRLGGGVIGFSDVKSSSVSKGETLADTIRMAESYSDIIVIRHPLEGAARLASKFTARPIVNAGDGSGQHPTQTLLDLFTIKKEIGRLDKLDITLVGDLKYGRTVHSLLLALARLNATVHLVSPPTLKIPHHVLSAVTEKIDVTESDDLSRVIRDTDVLYVTRIQKERFPDSEEYQKLIGSYSIDPEVVSKMKKTSIIMHPLPRVDEIRPEVDTLPQAKYFRQAFYGVPVRMALIMLLLGGEF
ncbi:aspartate carbamoyltransferase catalytic subunit [mine drainage metagenome]|uniref:aspartate carbamoyltransferase n=1 Tax=mine drainage metagenome TaxID=410659 RepID=T1C903_9ZZZZ